MSDQVWITHIKGEAPDSKIPRSALSTWMACGWSEREDQSDPVDEDPALGIAPEPVDDSTDEHDDDGADADLETPAHVDEPDNDDTKGA